MMIFSLILPVMSKPESVLLMSLLQLVRDQKTHERTKHQLEIEYEARERTLEMREVHLEQLEQKVRRQICFKDTVSVWLR